MTSCLLLLLLLLTSSVPRATVPSVSTNSVSALGRYQRHLPIIVVPSDRSSAGPGDYYGFKKFASIFQASLIVS